MVKCLEAEGITKIFGYNHGFLVGWFLFLTYVAILWANATALVLLALTLALALLFLLGPTVGSRRSGFFTGIAALLLTVMCWGFARSQKADAERHDTAIVMRPVTSVTSSPSSDSAKSLFILHEGTRVRILDEVSGYTDIELSDGRRGWLPSGDIEII